MEEAVSAMGANPGMGDGAGAGGVGGATARGPGNAAAAALLPGLWSVSLLLLTYSRAARSTPRADRCRYASGDPFR